MSRTVVAIFDVYANAEKAAFEVRQKGLRTDNISIIVKDSGNKGYLRPHREGQVYVAGYAAYPFRLNKRERIADGIVTGGIFGGVTGIILGAASMFMPRFGLIAAGGPIAGLVAGFVLGGIVGVIVDIRIPRVKKEEYGRLVSQGNAIFSMKVDEERMNDIIEIVKEYGALSVEKY
ncbi:hypothetical protein CLHUN_07430 [Ruminiclostridium hungatei]|uniref:Heat induced stress protein YflT n=1 Tax=Ruminiclostridium hungatei TaxID=48256 RepID=A0A1V4SQU5_RUMHU|nr:hypothetical protein [Ruminiclostridium hungatei]OPX45805.1 hypothetical protein CLHUN_07430 [Ruminiclostridium hungatei]